jgi:hypothetical protein
LIPLKFKYFAISCDMLDFLTILQDITLIRNRQLIYWTLGVWSWSTFQFFIFVPKFEDEEKREFTAYITNSLLSVLFLDLPYFGVRMAAIFGFGSHNYNSYFFATKNIVMILLQIVRIKATFSERTVRQDRAAKRLKDQIGFDKEASKLFDPHEVAKRNFLAERLKKQQQLEQQQTQNDRYVKNQTPDSARHNFTTDQSEKYESLDSMDEVGKVKPIKNYEAHQSMKRAIYKASNNSLDNIDKDLDMYINRSTPKSNYLSNNTTDEEIDMKPENRVIVSSRSPINNKNYPKNLVIETKPALQFKRYNEDGNNFNDNIDQSDYNYNRQPQATRPYMARTAFVPEQQQQKSPTQINQLYSSPKPILKQTNRKFTPV